MVMELLGVSVVIAITFAISGVILLQQELVKIIRRKENGKKN